MKLLYLHLLSQFNLVGNIAKLHYLEYKCGVKIKIRV